MIRGSDEGLQIKRQLRTYVIADELTLDEEAELETDARHMSLKIMLCNLDT